MGQANTLMMLLAVYGLLLAPKIMGALTMRRAGLNLRDMGGAAQFALSVTLELVLSVLYAPILMVQQTVAVLRTMVGLRDGWAPQARQGNHYSWLTMVKFHALETLTGLALIIGMGAGLVTLWLLPIAGSLAFAVPLSALSGVRLGQTQWLNRQLGTPDVFNAPAILKAARTYRAELRASLDQTDKIAAE